MAEANGDLIDRAVGGDVEALGVLLERLGPGVRRGIAGQIPRRWRSVLSEDDVMQQTYADALRDIRDFVPHGEDSLAAWLATVARRNLLDAVKMLEADKRGGDRRRVEPEAGDESFGCLFDLLTANGTTPSRHAARKEARSMLEAAIKRLPADYRRVIIMYDLQGLPAREVADAMGRSPGAFFMLRARALGRLRGQMGSASGFLTGSS